MHNIELDMDEVILEKAENAYFEKKKCEVYLTNKALIILVLGFFSGVKETRRYDVYAVKIFQERPHTSLEKTVWAVSFIEESISINFNDKKVARSFYNSFLKIHNLESTDSFKEFALPGIKFIAQSLVGTVNTVRDVLVQPTVKTVFCAACGAQLEGVVGKECKCKYCSNIQKVE